MTMKPTIKPTPSTRECPNPTLNVVVEELIDFLEWRAGKSMYKLTAEQIKAAMAIYSTAIQLCDAREQGAYFRAQAAAKSLAEQQQLDINNPHRIRDE